MLTLGGGTASLTNHVMSRTQSPDPEIGMGVTVLEWTDRKACTIVGIITYRGRKQMTIQEDTALRTDTNGMSDSQHYTYEANPNGHKYVFTQRADGDWAELGVRNGHGYGLVIGRRSAHHDYSF